MKDRMAALRFAFRAYGWHRSMRRNPQPSIKGKIKLDGRLGGSSGKTLRTEVDYQEYASHGRPVGHQITRVTRRAL